jgi:hypothetical protein
MAMGMCPLLSLMIVRHWHCTVASEKLVMKLVFPPVLVRTGAVASPIGRVLFPKLLLNYLKSTAHVRLLLGRGRMGNWQVGVFPL